MTPERLAGIVICAAVIGGTVTAALAPMFEHWHLHRAFTRRVRELPPAIVIACPACGRKFPGAWKGLPS